MSWKGPDRFSVTGLDERQRLNRVFLRFETADDASQAASTLKGTSGVIEEPLVRVEEVQVQARFLYTATGLVVLAYAIFSRLFIVGLFTFILFSALGLAAVVPEGLLILYLAMLLWRILAKRKQTTAFLRFEGKSLAVHSGSNWIPVNPKSIKWKDAKTLVFSGRSMKVEVFLATEDEAFKVVERMRSTFSGISGIPVLQDRPSL